MSPGVETMSAAKPKTRNGKIARLPYLQRDMVNRMLRDTVPYSAILEALRCEYGITVTERNISNWKTRGGYREWCQDQERALEVRLLQDNLTEFLRKNEASQLPEVGLQLASTHLSNFFLTPGAQQQLAADPEKYARTAAILCRLTGQIHALQKYRDESARQLDPKLNPERIKRDELEDVELTRSIYSAAKPPERARDPIVPRRNYLPKE